MTLKTLEIWLCFAASVLFMAAAVVALMNLYGEH